jgi:hypothetical protein
MVSIAAGTLFLPFLASAIPGSQCRPQTTRYPQGGRAAAKAVLPHRAEINAELQQTG